MKLLLYSHFFAPSIGGVETSVASLARGLAERESETHKACEITLVTNTAVGVFDDREFPFPIVRRPTLRRLWSLIRQNDIVHIAGPSLAPLFLAFVARKPFVVEHHGYQAICPNGLLTQLPNRTICPGHFQAHRYWKCLRCQSCELSLLRSLLSLLLMFPRSWLVRRAAKNVTITRHVLERHRLPRSGVVYYGIDDPLVKRDPGFFAANSGKAISFAYVGRFVSEKGIPILLQAAKSLAEEKRPFAVQLIGDGPERDKIEDTIRKEGLEPWVQLTGFRTGAALAEALSKVDVLVMPSVWEETAGLSAIEHMMRGKLVIGSDVGGLGEVIGDSGLRSVAGSVESLADCMRRVLQDSSLIDSLGRKARDRAVQLFDRDRMIDEHAKIYSGIASKCEG